MNHVHVLDCTLRDGGYCNQWKFGFDNIKKIIHGLLDANIDIIECGYITQKKQYDNDVTKYYDLSEFSSIIPNIHGDKIFVAMMNYGEFDVSTLPECKSVALDGIRVAFHKKNMDEALADCKIIKAKGYKVFVQAMVSLSYSDEEFLSLIHKVNEIEPYAFYIVDSFGMMKKTNLIRMFYIVENNLKEDIWIGFHSHNNMQLSYSNAQTLVDIKTNHSLIIDASVYGMGRGAGNLNTELFVDYLNENNGGKYKLNPLLNIIDEILADFYQKNYWGYSLPNYLAAAHDAHPNYASYLDEKRTLTVKDMNQIFGMMNNDKKVEFDKNYIEELYIQYMGKEYVIETHKSELIGKIAGKRMLIIAPGKSSEIEQEKINSYINLDDVVSVSVNYDYPYGNTDYIFLSNLRRYRELDKIKNHKCIVTSNIPDFDGYLRIEYKEWLNCVEAVRDNAGLMAIKFFASMNTREILLAGFDGYSHEASQNYTSEQMLYIPNENRIDELNAGMTRVLKEYEKHIPIKFITIPKNIII
ncbi:MAG: aldolase catalytic domain-containing protein [Butyrivibrio sp.]